MMNISLSHPVPTFGDALTITCYVCGMPSSKEWAQKARSRPSTPMKPFFPFLLQISPLGGAMIREDGSTYLCAFCHASLESQWHVYENQQVVPPPNRKYNIQKFICGVCGVETYRKRIRALPFQEFPFLEKQRQPGSITLGNNPLAVVCLDCSETLWAQSAEYDRWGLPVHKRHFNWMARPPPPEDSVEATVARLPSGETQLPRCPPIEPAVHPGKQVVEPPMTKLEATVSSKSRTKGKGEGSPKMESMMPMSSQSVRKTSLTSTTPPIFDLTGSFHSQQPPVVTVAPMSSHTTVISMRKDSLALPAGLMTPSVHPHLVPSSGLYPQSAVFPSSSSYTPYVWGSGAREAGQRSIEPYRYSPTANETIPGASTWPWLQHPSPDLLRYQYMSSLQRPLGPEYFYNRISESPATASGSPTQTPGHSSAISYATAESSSRYQSRDQERLATNSGERSTSTITSTRGKPGPGSSDEVNYQAPPRSKGSPELKSGKKSPKIHSARDTERTFASKPYPTHPKKFPKDSKEPGALQTTSNRRSMTNQAACVNESPSVCGSSLPAAPPVIAGDDQEKSGSRREFHIPKKRNWQVFMKESQSSQMEEEPKKTDEAISHHPKKKKSSLSMSESPDMIPNSREHVASKDDSNVSYPNKLGRINSSKSSQSESRLPRGAVAELAIDLTITPVSKPLKGAGAKFMIEYLCKSEPSVRNEECENSPIDDSAARTSVIRCAPKIPFEKSTSPEVKVEGDEDMSLKDCRKGSEVKEVESGNEEVHSPNDTLVVKEVSSDGGDDEMDLVREDKVMMHSRQSNIDEQARTDKSDKEGNSERKQQDSRIHDDVDIERKNEDLPNIEQFIKETISDLVKREKEQKKMRQETVDKQTRFLSKLGLITPDKRIELEIKSIVSRHERKTLPPLQLRADTQITKKIDQQLKELLLKVALQDPTLLQESPEPEKCNFMAELGMRAAEKSEKAKREMKWRVILMERVRRELRNAAARGMKHEWEKSDALRKFAECDLETFFDSRIFSDELSPLQDERQDVKSSRADNQNEAQCCKSGNSVCINYPKYIPSYAVKVEDEEAFVPDSTSEISQEIACTIEPILKIPVIPAKKSLFHSESSSGATGTSDSDDSELISFDGENIESLQSSSVDSLATKSSAKASPEQYPIRIDSMIQCSETHWEQMKRNIDDILNELENSKEDVPFEEKSSQIAKIRKHLKSQLSDIKEIEKRLRATGKNILTASRKKGHSKN